MANSNIRSKHLHFSWDICGETIQVRFIDRIRDEQKFDGIEELKAQLDADKVKSLELLK